ncbi:PP2C family serine/threonine-protein phosphatase [Streptacidiphilus rugosus]|uniref:PP2C family serine/threonine-protein phosphatase n=1 Tax=Streptacidiphilus rugosus TaxID=405783 RepID=UPI0009FED463|nr:PP2C family protein-serine/threonine phosphatase [Streptacidiphilus rugosus]
MDQLTLSCPNCAQPVAEADRYCEECGIDLAAARAATPDPRAGLPPIPATRPAEPEPTGFAENAGGTGWPAATATPAGAARTSAAEGGSPAAPAGGHPLGGAAAAEWPGDASRTGGVAFAEGEAGTGRPVVAEAGIPAASSGRHPLGGAAAAEWPGGEGAHGGQAGDASRTGGVALGAGDAGGQAAPTAAHPLGGGGWPSGDTAGAAAGSGMTGDFVLAAPVLVSEDEGAEEGPRCVGCGAQRIDTDGYCEVCGRAQPRPRDHQERALAGVCGVSDRGHRHHRNEDAFAVAATSRPGGAPAVVAVVCDGVSSATRPDEASQAAADSASESLLEQLESGEALETAMEKAILAAAARVDALADEFEREPSRNSPACTIVSAVVAEGRVTVGWVGDSRAYWMPDDRSGATRLTVDDSWATRMVEAGLMSEAEAFADPRAHAITGWLGADAIEVEPHTVSFVPESTGAVLICTDGLWNYLEAAADLAAVVPADARTRPLQAAQTLVRYACDRGGHDNITVALLPIDRVEGVDASEPDHPATLAVGTLDSPTIQLREGES